MLEPTVSCAGPSFTNLLHVIVRTGNHHLPHSATSWAVCPVRRDRHGRFVAGNGFRFPEQGAMATASCASIAHSCGLQLATTEEASDAELWNADPFDILPANDLLLLAYQAADLLHSEGSTVRVRHAFVVAHVSGLELIKAHGAGADLHGFWLSDSWLNDYATEAMMHLGATYRELAEVVARRIDSRHYYHARVDGASHRQVLKASRPDISYQIKLVLKRHGKSVVKASNRAVTDPINVVRYLMAREARVPIAHAAQLALTDLSLVEYLSAREVATHPEIMHVPDALGHSSLGRYTTLRRNGRDHDTAVTVCAQQPPF
jgi:hypothetical protein